MCKFYNQLKTIIDEDSPEDKKLLLLAAMIDDMRSEFDKAQRHLQKKVEESLGDIRTQLSDVDEKLQTLQTNVSEKVSAIQKDVLNCPVHKSKQAPYVEFALTYPKLTLVVILLLGYLVGIFGPGIIEKIISLF